MAKTSKIIIFTLFAVFSFASRSYAATPVPNTTTINETWTAVNSPYIVDGNIYYRYGALNIESGTVVKFANTSSSLDIHADVDLKINGTADAPVYFTSIKDDSVGGDTNEDGNATSPSAGDWGYVSIGGGAYNHGLNINYLKVRYGGSSAWGSASPALILIFSWYYGYDTQDYYLKNVEVSNSTTGLYVYVGGNHKVYISDSSFHDNSDYGMYADLNFPYAATKVNAINNWWGSDSGPYHQTLNPSGTGNRVSDNIDFIPWLEHDPENNQPLSFRAAALAKQVVNHQEAYLLGGKGWDYNLKEFVTATNLLSGYTYKKNTAGIGVDCSGLIMWAYDRSFDPYKSPSNNFVKAPNADEQYKHNTTPITESQLQLGDVMFFDWNSDDRIDHVAMYVGESGGYDVVNSADSLHRIVPAHLNNMKNLAGFREFKRVASSTPLAMVVTSHSPVDLIVTDPDGFTITPTTTIPSDTEYLREIPDILYYSEMEQGEDGNPIDRVYSYTEKTGNYNIKVIPNAGIPPESTFTLDFTKGDQTIILAQDVPVDQVPSDGYGVRVGEDNSISLIQTLIPSADTYVKLENPNKNQGTESKLNLQYLDAHHILIQFNQEEIRTVIPIDKNIVSAKLQFNITKNGNMWGKNGNTIGVYRMIKPWTESGATWLCANDTNISNSRPDCPNSLWGMAGLTKLRPYATSTTDTQTITNNQSGAVSFDVTNNIKKFLSGETQNYGWLIKKTNIFSTGWIEFGSRESIETPKLIIETK